MTEHTPIPFQELAVFQSLQDVQVVFDVGARADVDYLALNPEAEYHLFEPNPEFFDQLQEKVGNRKNVHLNNFGLGDKTGKYAYSNFYQAFTDGEAQIEGTNQTLEIRTLDDYIAEHGIKRIDFLKIDTEGYDYKVLLGGSQAVKMAHYIQYEHWDNKQQFHDLLGNEFDMEYIGFRNVLCTRK
jgi:FkbM family methyltransferase